MGGALFAPYAILAAVALPLVLLPVVEVGNAAVIGLGTALALAAIATTSLLPVVRTVEAVAVPPLLGGPAELLVVLPVRSWRDRVRNGGWYLAHTSIGAVASLVSVVLPPLAVALTVGAFRGEAVAAFGTYNVRTTPTWGLALAVALLAGTAAVIWAAGAALAWMAPRLLGPSWATRVAELERRTLELAERNRLARELHDSVGHALTLTTLQAGAARAVLETDRAFVAQALRAIEETGREAAAELDGLLQLLRERDASRRPQPTLTDLGTLVEAHQSAGFDARVEVEGDLARVPAVVSREGYRIVQEGLTNVRRHSAGAESTVRLTVTAERLRIEVRNPAPRSRPVTGKRLGARRAGGLGLAGVRERVQLLGGAMQAAPTGDHGWLLTAELPIGSRP